MLATRPSNVTASACSRTAIDNQAAGSYLIYRHTEGDFTAGDKISLDGFDMIIAGGKINF